MRAIKAKLVGLIAVAAICTVLIWPVLEAIKGSRGPSDGSKMYVLIPIALALGKLGRQIAVGICSLQQGLSFRVKISSDQDEE